MFCKKLFKKRIPQLATALIATGLLHAPAAFAQQSEDLPSKEALWKMLQEQQEKIESLEKQVKETQEQNEAVAEAVDMQAQGAGAQGGADAWYENTQLGGYGELHYNGGEKDQIDFHRFVAYVNHQFSDSIRLFSEIELEHSLAGDDKPGEVELEQAYIEFDVTEAHRVKAGLFLVPVGILNEVHEPTTFLGVERNPVESAIIPTTWWEAGVAASGELLDTLRYDIAFHSGLDTPVDGGSAFKIRSGRQKVAEANASDGAVTARLRWNAIPGVEIAGSAQYQNDVTQSAFEEDVEAILLETHADIRKGPIGFRALYARWDLDGDAPAELGRDVQQGWYVEPAYYLDTPIGPWAVFGRYNRYDNEAGNSDDTEYDQYDVGLNYWPHEDVVLKADMSFVEAPSEEADDEILNLGVGFRF